MRRLTRAQRWSAGVALFSASAAALAVEPAVLVAPAAGDDAELGFSAAIDGGWVALGAPGHVAGTGSAMLFDCTAMPCAPAVNVTAPAAIAGARFGFAVAVSGTTVAIGAPQDGNGRVYVYVRNGNLWSLQAQLAAFDGAPGDRFGTAVALDGDRLAVGADRDNSQRGAAYLFQRAGGSWTQVTRVTGAGTAAGDRFGAAVAIDGTRLAIGAPYHDPSGSAAGYARGAAYVYTISGATVTQDAKLVPGDSTDAALFGFALSVDGTHVAVGAPGFNEARGVVYVFDRGASTWSQQARLPWLGAGAGAAFGRTVAIEGARLLSGAPFSGTAAPACGLVQLYNFDGATWLADPLALPVLPAASERSGWSVAVDGNQWLLGAPGLSVNGPAAGGGYLFNAGDDLFGDGFENGAATCGAGSG
jgi:hypothetical protein